MHAPRRRNAEAVIIRRAPCWLPAAARDCSCRCSAAPAACAHRCRKPAMTMMEKSRHGGRALMFSSPHHGPGAVSSSLLAAESFKIRAVNDAKSRIKRNKRTGISWPSYLGLIGRESLSMPWRRRRFCRWPRLSEDTSLPRAVKYRQRP